MATISQALRLALHYGEKYLGVKNILGEDVGPPLGGVFSVTQGLSSAQNTPLDERGIIGAGIGLALAGLRTVIEIQFCDYIFNSIDLLKIAGSVHWLSNSQYSLPLLLMTPVGSVGSGSIYHSHSFESIATHIPGWKVVMPSDAESAYRLMIAALKDENPVLFLIPKALIYKNSPLSVFKTIISEQQLKTMINKPSNLLKNDWAPEWPELIETNDKLSQARLIKDGNTAVVITYGRYVDICKEICENLDVAIIDLQTIYPFDFKLISTLVEKTCNVIIINEDTEVTNFGEHLYKQIVDQFFPKLKKPPTLVTGLQVPGIGLAKEYEDISVPSASLLREKIQQALL